MDFSHTRGMSPRSAKLIDNEENEYVITRTGRVELLDPNQIVARLTKLKDMHPQIKNINPHTLMRTVTPGLKSGITTKEIDEFTADTAASMSTDNPYYLKLAGRIAVSAHQKNTSNSFRDKVNAVYLSKDKFGCYINRVSETFCKYVEEHQKFLEATIDYDRDFLVDFFGMRTFQKQYGLKVNDVVIERPQDLYLRTAVQIHMHTCSTIEEEYRYIAETYDCLSHKQYTHGSPTYFSAGTDKPQMASCFLLGTGDSAKAIMETADQMSEISKWGGGIGVHCNDWRGAGSLIRGTNGTSSGVGPFLNLYQSVLHAFNQSGRRPGSAAVYLMPHHPDIELFLQMGLPQGDNDSRARKLFYGIWIPDIFMEYAAAGKQWSLFDPDQVGDLSLLYDEKSSRAYSERYLELESSKRYVKQIPAQSIWHLICESNRLTGMPYVCFSDTVNRLSNQKNLGTIRSSNLCSEIVEYSDVNETAVCNLASISLAACVKDSYTEAELLQPEETRRELDHEFPINPIFDWAQLSAITRTVTLALNRVIDKTFYPTEQSERSNVRHRPIGIGVQGLADVYMKFRFPFDSEEAVALNKAIFEAIYYSALSRSTQLCREEVKRMRAQCEREGSVTIEKYVPGKYDARETVTYTDQQDIPNNACAYASMYWNGGSPLANGKFHWELAGLTSDQLSGRHDWETLRNHISEYGVRNSLLVALMPTASTSQFLGNNECIEPYTSNIYKRQTLAGTFTVINKYLIHDLFRLGFWKNNTNIKDFIILQRGSVQNIGLPPELERLYRTAYEIPPEALIDQAADRQPFVDQAQSLNLWIENYTEKKYIHLMYRAYDKGLKTGNYYLRTRARVTAQQFTIDPLHAAEMKKQLEKEKNARDMSFLEPVEPVCDLCSS